MLDFCALAGPGLARFMASPLASTLGAGVPAVLALTAIYDWANGKVSFRRVEATDAVNVDARRKKLRRCRILYFWLQLLLGVVAAGLVINLYTVGEIAKDKAGRLQPTEVQGCELMILAAAAVLAIILAVIRSRANARFEALSKNGT